MNRHRYFQYAFAILIPLATLVPLEAGEPNQRPDDTDMNVIATNAFLVLKAVPTIGLELSISGLEQIVATHHRLSRERGVSQRHLSLILADAVAYTIITEIHRAERARLGLDQDMTPKSVPLDKKTVVRLWKANMPDFAALVRKALQGKDTLTSYVAEQSSEEEVLNGRMIYNSPVGQIRTRISELRRAATLPIGQCICKNPSPDQHLIFALVKSQAFRDLTVIVDLYEQGDLPKDSAVLRSTIDGVLKRYPERRVDSGMKMSSFKVWATFTDYYPENTSQDVVGPAEEYCLRQALVLAPFMTNTSSLPELAKKALLKISRSTASPPSK